MPRLLLIEPPFYRLYKDTMSLNRYPLALGYLAGTVKSETSWEVMAYNADFSATNEPENIRYMTGRGYQAYLENLKSLSGSVWHEVRKTIEAYRPDVVGISAKSANYASARLVAAIAKDLDKRTTVLVGGPHPSTVGAEVLSCSDVDVAVRGEGEQTIVDLLHAIERDSALDGIPGVVFKRNGAIVENAPRQPIENLDRLCFPHQSAPDVLKDFAAYPLDAFNRIFSTRGCPFACFFCGSRNIWGRTVRHRSIPNVIQEINALRAQNIKEVHFADDTFGVSRERIIKLCGAMRAECPGLRWSCEIHVNLVDDATIAVMRRAGCVMIQLGIESGNNQILKAMRKEYTIEKALRAARTIKRHGITLFTFFMIGFPPETEETMRDTMKAMYQADSDMVSYSIFTPYPGTEAFEHCKRNGMIDASFDVSLHNHQSPANHFCTISPARFRELASEVETAVQKRNRQRRIKRLFSSRTIIRLRELGIRESFHRISTFLRWS